MSTSRIISHAINFLSEIFWKTQSLTAIMSFKHFSSVKNTLTRGFIIATILILVTNSLIVLTSTMESDTVSRIYSDQGFDLEIQPNY